MYRDFDLRRHLVLTPEIFPNRVRGRAASIATLTNCRPPLSVLWFPPFVAAFSLHSAFFTFSAICLVATVFFWKLVPETKGKSLEEIERHWMEIGQAIRREWLTTRQNEFAHFPSVNRDPDEAAVETHGRNQAARPTGPAPWVARGVAARRASVGASPTAAGRDACSSPGDCPETGRRVRNYPISSFVNVKKTGVVCDDRTPAHHPLA